MTITVGAYSANLHPHYLIFVDPRKNETAITFRAFLTDFNDQFKADWSEETTAYGRMDPIADYGGTTRLINVSFTAPAESAAAAQDNLNSMSRLIRLLYPNWTTRDAATANIAAKPVIGVKFGNLIQDNKSKGALHGIIKGLSLRPNLDAGMFMVSDQSGAAYLPKELEISFEFLVLHDHMLGYDGANKPQDGFASFPYNYSDLARNIANSLLASFQGIGQVEGPVREGNQPSDLHATAMTTNSTTVPKTPPAQAAEAKVLK